MEDTLLSRWLENPVNLAEARSELTARFAEGKNDAALRENVRQWLLLHGKELRADVVFSSWLKAGGDRGFIADGLSDWLEVHATSLEAGFILICWLDAGGKRKTIVKALQENLTANATRRETSFLLSAWMKAGGGTTVLLPYMMAWLSVFGWTEEASFVLSRWLDARGNKTLVQGVILRWLSVHGEVLEADYIITAWLEAGGDPSIIESAVVRWLSVHERLPQAFFVMVNWLEAGGSPERICPHMVNWMATNPADGRAPSLLRGLAARRDLSPQMMRQALAFCGERASQRGSLAVLTDLCDRPLEDDHAVEALAVAERIVSCHAKGARWSKPFSLRCAACLASLAGHPVIRKGHLDRVDRLFERWLLHFGLLMGGELPDRIMAQSGALLEALGRVLRGGFLEGVDHEESVRMFLAWVADWEPETRAVGMESLLELEGLLPPELFEVARRPAETGQERLERIRSAHEEGSDVEGVILRKTKVGYEVDVGVPAFLPFVEVALYATRIQEPLIGKRAAFSVIKMNEGDPRVVISRRAVLERPLLEKLRVGDVLTAVVRNTQKYGIFVDLGGLSGLIHASELVAVNNHGSRRFRRGERVVVEVINVNVAARRVNLRPAQEAKDLPEP
ncbi:MAG: hypothetical protein CVU65_08805 [Deltaproteobacteria bacterium HGW-Deltaproteobacteria-22]|nr:MAG: hypothetical protein CVU65_08805 [Deltaproteobacteria bacterium HGW-Deltaproteobacteria-22]